MHSGSRAAILALSSLTMRSRVVKRCLDFSSLATSYFMIRLGWMPGHSVIAGSLNNYGMGMGRKRFRGLYALRKVDLSIVVEVLTGNCPI